MTSTVYDLIFSVADDAYIASPRYGIHAREDLGSIDSAPGSLLLQCTMIPKQEIIQILMRHKNKRGCPLVNPPNPNT